MRINRLYLNKFKEYKFGYLYMIRSGVFLLFNKNTLEFEGLYYHYTTRNIDKEADQVLTRLVSLDYLEL